MPSSRPAKKSTASRGVTSVGEWKKNKLRDGELDLPSGNRCLLKRPGLPQLIAEGLIPDTLQAIMQGQINKGRKGKKPVESEIDDSLAEVMSDPQKMQEAFDMMDRICAHVMVEPPLKFHKFEIVDGAGVWEVIPDEDRDPEVLYTDDVDEMDKNFIFQFVVGGTRDLERFRQQFGSGMGGVQIL